MAAAGPHFEWIDEEKREKPGEGDPTRQRQEEQNEDLPHKDASFGPSW